MRKYDLLVPLLMAIFTGCGAGADPSGRIAVSGMVTLDGAPVTAGRVNFIPDGNTDSPAAGGAIDAEGNFNIPAVDGPKPGTYKVKFILNSGSPRDKFDRRAQKDGLEIQQSIIIAKDDAAKLQFKLTSPPTNVSKSR